MIQAPVDDKKRKFLTTSTSVVGGAGLVLASIPFIKSWNPSEKAKAAGSPIEIDVLKMAVGQLMRVEWQSKPVWIVRRTEQSIKELEDINDLVQDPLSEEPQQPYYAKNINRSIRKDFFVAVGICTHLGCSPTYIPNNSEGKLSNRVTSGFFCPCHGSAFDMSGRVFKNVPAPLNLMIPPHHFAKNNNLIIGLNPGSNNKKELS